MKEGGRQLPPCKSSPRGYGMVSVMQVMCFMTLCLAPWVAHPLGTDCTHHFIKGILASQNFGICVLVLWANPSWIPQDNCISCCDFVYCKKQSRKTVASWVFIVEDPLSFLHSSVVYWVTTIDRFRCIFQACFLLILMILNSE